MLLAWIGFTGFILLLLALDLGVFHKKDVAISTRDAIGSSLFYVFIAMVFNAVLYFYLGRDSALEFLTGYLIEKTLSIDNIFVFSLLFAEFKVPIVYQHRVLFWGILGAIVMRMVLILVGASLLQKFQWMIYAFGGVLMLSGVKMMLLGENKKEFKDSFLYHTLKRYLRITSEFQGHQFLVKINHKIWLTPLCIVLVMIESTDLIFALDSIPAIFAVTKDPFIVFSANIFAILGLRSLYFILARGIEKFHYLKIGLSLILLLVGLKMILNEWFKGKIISVEWTLGATLGIIILSMVASVCWPRRA